MTSLPQTPTSYRHKIYIMLQVQYKKASTSVKKCYMFLTLYFTIKDKDLGVCR